jgi:hypothetical protein
MNDLEQYQWDKADMAVMGHECGADRHAIGYGGGLARQGPRRRRPGGKIGRRCDRWLSPLAVYSETIFFSNSRSLPIAPTEPAASPLCPDASVDESRVVAGGANNGVGDEPVWCELKGSSATAIPSALTVARLNFLFS